jgi:glycosyltransferase involved in cell wall biosynthesis
MATGIERLLGDDDLRSRLSANAARDVRVRFDRKQQAESYLAWYQEIRAKGVTEASPVYALPTT